MKVLSIRQPHAHLLRFQGLKRFETRKRKTQYRGELGIHASQWVPPRTLIEKIREQSGGLRLDILPADPEFYSYGALIAIGQLVDVARITPDLAEAQNPVELAVGFWERPFAWEIGNNLALREPIPMRGRITLWDWEPPGSLETLPPLFPSL